MCLLLEAVRANPLTIEALKWDEKAYARMNVGVPSYVPPQLLSPFVALSSEEPTPPFINFCPKQSSEDSKKRKVS